MSSKINVLDIIKGHIRTLADPNGKALLGDQVTFFLLPALIAIFVAFKQVSLSQNLISLLVNFGAIFTALLLSVLVLVYDQERRANTGQNISEDKKLLFNQLYYNICYSIICSLALVVLCITDSFFDRNFNLPIRDYFVTINVSKLLTTPLVVFIFSNLLFTIMMIVKRMHITLTTENK